MERVEDFQTCFGQNSRVGPSCPQVPGQCTTDDECDKGGDDGRAPPERGLAPIAGRGHHRGSDGRACQSMRLANRARDGHRRCRAGAVCGLSPGSAGGSVVIALRHLRSQRVPIRARRAGPRRSCPTSRSPRTLASRSASRTARSQTPRYRSACRRPGRAPARAHVGRRAENDAIPRAAHRDGGSLRDVGVRRVACSHLGEAEVRRSYDTCRGDPEVDGLEIARPDAALVRGFERLGHLLRARQRVGDQGGGSRRMWSASVSPSTNSRTSAGVPSTASSP